MIFKKSYFDYFPKIKLTKLALLSKNDISETKRTMVEGMENRPKFVNMMVSTLLCFKNQSEMCHRNVNIFSRCIKFFNIVIFRDQIRLCSECESSTECVHLKVYLKPGEKNLM